MKNFLILSAGFGEGHNAAGRGIRDAIRQLAPDARVEVRDLFAETLGAFNEWVCRGYLQVINRVPHVWSTVYSAIDRAREFRAAFRLLAPVRYRLAEVIAREKPDAIISVYPAYAHFLDEIFGPACGASPKRVVCITDSMSINAIWFRCSADFFLVANEQSAAMLERGGVAPSTVQVLGFPVSPQFALLELSRCSCPPWRIIYMVNAGNVSAPALAERLAAIPATELTVTVSGSEKLRRAIESVRANSSQPFRVIGWTIELPQLLASHHLLVSKAGGATVQESIAARCPIVINQIIPGQEEGNAQLIAETGSGCIALSNDAVVGAVAEAVRDEAKLLRAWSANIAKISRPRAALDIASFLLAIS